jgi:flagellar biogenesis protein FliO
VGKVFAVLAAHAARVHRGLKRRRSVRRLRLSETLSLGEKRFLAVVQFQHQEFLVGGTGNSIALLARLDAPGMTPDSQDGTQEDGS